MRHKQRMFFENTLHYFRECLKLKKILLNIAFKLIERFCPQFSYGIRLYILIKQFIRVQFRAISRHSKHYDSRAVFRNPIFSSLGFMYRMAINNNKNLLPFMFNQPFKKINEKPRCKFTSITSKGKITTVGNTGNYICAKSFSGTRNYECLITRDPRCSRLVIRTHSSFILPGRFPPSILPLAF